MKTPQRYANLSKVYLNENDFFYISNEITEELQELYDLIITTVKMLNLEIAFVYHKEINSYLITFINKSKNHIFIEISLYGESNMFKEISIDSSTQDFVDRLIDISEEFNTIIVNKCSDFDDAERISSGTEGIIDLLKSFLRCI